MKLHMLSIVIPAFNEAVYLPHLLDSIDVARNRLTGVADTIEVIVANNGPTDDTAAIAHARGCLVVDVDKRAIAAARNGGAAAASGQTLCFVDADLRIHPDTLAVITDRMRSGRVAGGASGWRLDRRSAGLIATVATVRALTWLAGVNAGVVFCRRDIFREVGGYNENRRFAEDVQFFRDMRRAGKRRGLKTLLNVGTPAVVSTRKFDRHGDWHMFAMGLWILRNRSLDKTVENYWYDKDRRF